jgi:TatD DNase family protein
MRLFDTHCHLQWEKPEWPLHEVLARAEQAGVGRMVCVGVDAATSRRAREIAAEVPAVSASAGIHPNDLPPVEGAARAALAELDALVAEGGWVAVGETGLDLYWDKVPLEVQQLGFRHHLDLAAAHGLPVIIHCRDAGAETLALLQGAGGPVAGVMHCFADTPDRVAAYLDLGLHISFAGNLTYKSARELREAALLVPEDRLLVETDAPFLAPVPKRGKRNEPAFVHYTLSFLAELRGTPADALAETTSANAERLFGAG